MAIFVKLGDIKGDVTAQGFKDWIEVHSLQWGVGRGIHTPTGSSQEREASAPSLSEVTLTKAMDRSSTYMFTEAVSGISKPVEIVLVKTGPNALEKYCTIKLTNTLVSSWSLSSGGDKPTESLSLNFTKIEVEYVPYDNEHNAGNPERAAYDISAGKKI